MKVVGTGAPRMLTVRVESCEVGVLRDELHHRRAVITEAAAHTHGKGGSRGAGAGDREVEDCHDELLLILRMLDELRKPVPEGRPRELIGPTWLLAPVIRGAAMFAAERFADAVKDFAADTGSPTPDELNAVMEAVRACTATLIGLDYAENHAVDR